MARSTLFRVTVSTAVAVLATIGMSGCIGGGSGPTPTPTTSSPTATPTPTPTPTSTVTPTTPLASPTATPTPTTPPSKTVSMQILNSAYDPSTSTISVAGMVTDLVSQTGVCTATATQDAQSASAQSPGMADAAVTYCSNLSIVLPAGSSGTWNVELSFADESHSGTASIATEVG